MFQNFYLVLCVYCTVYNAKFPKNFQVLLLLKNVVNLWINHFWSQVLDKLLRYEIIHDKLVVSQQFLYHIENCFSLLDFVSIVVLVVLFSWNHAFDQISQNEHDPFWHMDLEHFVTSDQLSNRFVNCVVQFDELFALVVFLFEDGLLVAVRF